MESLLWVARFRFKKKQPFVIYNIYSDGSRDRAFAELIKLFDPDPSCILIGDFNCHHPWWYGDIKSTKHNMKTRQVSTNANTIVEWLEKQNFKLHSKTSIPTYYPRDSNKSPTLIDLCFSRGEITQWINTWFVDDDSTSDHSIIGIRITPPTNRISCNCHGVTVLGRAGIPSMAKKG
jgi:endonuclease/exonuclease/phosphatase family metal-dependent hydrolase